MASSVYEVKELPDSPFQPTNISFPSRSFGVAKPVNRSFQASWFNRFHWLHYDTALDSAFCFVCCKAIKQKKVLITGVAENAFIIDGFNNWKDATRVYSKHEASYFHKQAFDSLKARADVGEMLSSQYAQEKRTNRKYLMQVLSSVRYLARQGLAMRGDKDETTLTFISFYFCFYMPRIILICCLYWTERSLHLLKFKMS